MQKNRTAVAAGILALALIVGGFALWNSQKASNAPVTANGPVLGNTPDTAGKDPLGPNDTETPAITNETDMPTSVEVKPNEGTTGKSNTPGTTTAVISRDPHRSA